ADRRAARRRSVAVVEEIGQRPGERPALRDRGMLRALALAVRLTEDAHARERQHLEAAFGDVLLAELADPIGARVDPRQRLLDRLELSTIAVGEEKSQLSLAIVGRGVVDVRRFGAGRLAARRDFGLHGLHGVRTHRFESRARPLKEMGLHADRVRANGVPAGRGSAYGPSRGSRALSLVALSDGDRSDLTGGRSVAARAQCGMSHGNTAHAALPWSGWWGTSGSSTRRPRCRSRRSGPGSRRIRTASSVRAPRRPSSTTTRSSTGISPPSRRRW